jgi:FkbM family methyltransferase
MAHYWKELVTDFMVNPLNCYRHLLRDHHLAELWQKAQQSGGSIYVRPANIPGDFVIDLRSHLALNILEIGTYEEEITDYIARLTLTKSGVVVNVGANIGLMSVFLANKFERKTIAIEPNPEAFEFLQKNISMNRLSGAVTCIQACVGSETGQMDFSYVRGKPEYSSIGEIVHPCVNNEAREVISVPVKPLNQLVTEPVAFMLVDTEGAEELVFEGAREIIQRDHPIIMCECSDVLLPKFGTSARNVVNRLIAHGYKVCDVVTGGVLGCDVPQGFSSNVLATFNG